jgi:hypothetical protein
VQRFLAGPQAFKCSDSHPRPIPVALLHDTKNGSVGPTWVPCGPSDLRHFLRYNLDLFFSHATVPHPRLIANSRSYRPQSG